MTTQFQAIRKILDLAAQDGRVEQAIEELEKFAELRFCEAFKYIESVSYTHLTLPTIYSV